MDGGSYCTVPRGGRIAAISCKLFVVWSFPTMFPHSRPPARRRRRRQHMFLVRASDHQSHRFRGFAVESAFRQILQSGTCLFLPTVITSSIETYRHVLPLIVHVASKDEFKDHIPGLHLEGPFLCPRDGARGCHSLSNIAKPSVAVLKELAGLCQGKLMIVTIAANEVRHFPAQFPPF